VVEALGDAVHGIDDDLTIEIGMSHKAGKVELRPPVVAQRRHPTLCKPPRYLLKDLIWPNRLVPVLHTRSLHHHENGQSTVSLHG